VSDDSCAGAGPARSIESLLSTCTSTAYARFTHDGVLICANPRFLEIGRARIGVTKLADLVVEGQRAEMDLLLGDGQRQGRTGTVHFASGEQPPTTLTVSWGWDDDELLMIGEPPFSDLETTQTMLVKLNGRVSELARENAKKSVQLERALEDLKQAQTLMVHREKMAALGQMTAGVAHELNNPLAYVKNNLHLLGEGLDDVLALINLFGEGLEDLEVTRPALFDALMEKIEAVDLVRLGEHLPGLVESADQGVERAAQLVDSLRRFSRLDEAEVKTIDLNHSLMSVVEFVGFLIKKNQIEFSATYGELPPVTCSPGNLNQAVLNILTNAIQASAPGGNVSLSTRRSGADVLIQVTDDGPGVPEEFIERIFDPFFTTRPIGEGTGLGLSIAHTVVAAHDGHITVEEAEGGGAVFTVHLPLGEGITE